MDSLYTEHRAEVTGNRITGYAAVFSRPTALAGHDEQIAPGAFDAVLADPATDVRAMFNHDAGRILGRQSAGTLRLDVDEVGLRYEVDLPDTSYAADLRAMIARGDVSGSSFGFIPAQWRDELQASGRRLRTHTSIGRLIDVSAVPMPAYAEATVALRSLDPRAAARARRSQLIVARLIAQGVVKK